MLGCFTFDKRRSPIGWLHLAPLSYHARPSSPNISPQELLLPSFQLCFYRSLFISTSCRCSRAAVPGGTPSVQAATGSGGRVLLRELPVRPPQSRLGSRRGGAPTWRRSHRRGYWEAALPNGGYVMKTEPFSHSEPVISMKNSHIYEPRWCEGYQTSDEVKYWQCISTTRTETQRDWRTFRQPISIWREQKSKRRLR